MCTTYRRSRGIVLRGVALVTVMAIMTVMALLAVMFIVLVEIERMSSNQTLAGLQAWLIAASAREHALAILAHASGDTPGCTHPGQAWRTAFTKATYEEPNGTNQAGDFAETRWFPVKNSAGMLMGRYAVIIEDEAAKLNINVAAACSTHEQNQGVGTFELLLSDGRGRGLPIDADMAQRIVLHRYGPDGKPGRAGVDDNMTAARYQTDEIDNNANGIVDEPGEGVDEPEEYSPTNLRGDDRVFMSVQEMLGIGPRGAQMSESTRLLIKRLATVNSRSKENFWDDRSHSWQPCVNINVADKNQVMDVLTKANTDGQFEPVAKDLRQLGANVLDYRDENHVLTTAGSEYGVEAVCFNEVLAYDASWIRKADLINGGEPWGADDPSSELYDPDRYFQILNYGFFYCRYCTYVPGVYTPRDYTYRWRIARFSKTSLSLRVPLRITEDNMPRFLKCDTRWPADLWKDAEVRMFTNASQYYTCKANGNAATSARTLSISGVTDQQLKDTGANATVILYNGWNFGYAPWCQDPWRSEMFLIHAPTKYPVERYYQVYMNANHTSESTPAAAKCPQDLDVDGDITKHSMTMPVHGKYIYMEGKAQRPNALGYVPVTVTSSRNCKNNFPGNDNTAFFEDNFRGNLFWRFCLIRPDIIELINISRKPITMRNWGIVVNTGKDAWDLARLDTARRFSVEHGPLFDDPNPTIPSNGYFYLTNNREIFSLEHASGNSEYGGVPTDTIPVYQIPQEGWGILYKVVQADWGSLKVEGSDWKKDQMVGELIESVVTKKVAGEVSADGQILVQADGHTPASRALCRNRELSIQLKLEKTVEVDFLFVIAAESLYFG